MSIVSLTRGDKKPGGTADIEGGSLLVDCSDCDGKRDLGSRGCFICLSSLVTPGFSGEIVLKGDIDRGYRGPAVDAVLAMSSIRSSIKSLKAGQKGVLRFLRSKALCGRMMSLLERDPVSLVDSGPDLIERAERIGPDTADQVRDVVEAAERMVFRLK